MVDKKIVEHVAQLARIDITDQEKARLAPELSTILDYIDQLKTLDVTRVSPTRGAVTQVNIFRQDSARVSASRDAILKNAPAQEDNYFKIPKVLE